MRHELNAVALPILMTLGNLMQLRTTVMLEPRGHLLFMASQKRNASYRQMFRTHCEGVVSDIEVIRSSSGVDMGQSVARVKTQKAQR